MSTPLMIGPYSTGLQKNVQPWLINEDAFATLEDAYIYRGRVRKRWGYRLPGDSQLTSRLRINLGTTNGSGALSGTVPGTVFKVGQMFSIGDKLYTVNATGTPAAMLQDGTTTTATFDTTTGAYVFNGGPATTDAFFYPSEPVMGLRPRWNSNLNVDDVIGFDTQFAYQRSGGGWTRLGTGASATWTGTNYDFFWTINARGANPYDTNFYCVNYTRADNIRYLPAGSTTWTNLQPQLDAGATRTLDSCKLLIYFKDRLVALNTLETEGATPVIYQQRARFSQNGDPTAAATAWLDDTPGRGGFTDAYTEENIITAEVIKDRLIVYFERSTWELIYTGFKTLPFRWQKLNDELGASGTFSIIGFDDAAVGVGNVGVHACDGVSVKRLDQKIPDEVFSFQNANQGDSRVYGIRDYAPELVYWTFPSATGSPTFPQRVLVYNYKLATWSIFKDSFTCFGQFQNESTLTWATVGQYYPSWSAWNVPWNAGRYQTSYPDIMAGNQVGFTVILDTGSNSNAPALYITDMGSSNQLTIVDHNLEIGSYLYVEDATGITSLNGVVVRVNNIVNDDVIEIDTTFTGTYLGGGVVTRVSRPLMLTKQFNFGTELGKDIVIKYTDFLLAQTTNGQISVNTYIDAGTTSVEASSASGILFGDATIPTSDENPFGSGVDGSYSWHRYFMPAEGAFVQLELSLSEAQLKDYDVATSTFELEAILLYPGVQGRVI